MAATIPSYEPTEATAGDSWRWDKVVSDYPPSDGWALSYALTGAHESVLTISASTSEEGDYYEVRVPAATTLTYTAGRYTLFGYVTKATDRFQVFKGALTVHPDAATAVPDVGHAEKMLGAIRGVLEGRIPADAESYQIAGRSITRIPFSELRKAEAFYADRVRRERSGRFFQNVKVEFGPAS